MTLSSKPNECNQFNTLFAMVVIVVFCTSKTLTINGWVAKNCSN
jgi:hypothetical protein